MSKAIFRRRPYISLIGDMVKSRELTQAQRPHVQKRFQNLMKHLNKSYSKNLLSKFVITLGDEFQGILSSSSIIPDLMWRLEAQFPDREIRLGVGLGIFHTPVQEYAINIDGPSLHNARAAIEYAKKHRTLGGVFRGFGKLDEVLDGMAGILCYQRTKMTAQQRRIANLLRTGVTQSEAAETLKISRQAISKHVQSSGWQYYSEAETAWKIILTEYVDPMIGSR